MHHCVKGIEELMLTIEKPKNAEKIQLAIGEVVRDVVKTPFLKACTFNHGLPFLFVTKKISPTLITKIRGKRLSGSHREYTDIMVGDCDIFADSVKRSLDHATKRNISDLLKGVIRKHYVVSTTYFVDLESGNDANNGTTFALRKKTVPSALTAAAAGDTVRVMASLYQALGVNITLTNKSITATLASALTTMIDTGDSIWTGSANVTPTVTTTRKEGTGAASLNIAGAFATGIVAYKATGTLDLSAYQQISFSLSSTIGIAAGVLRVDLCSDTVGAVPVYSFLIPAISTGTIFGQFTIDNLSQMTSATAIQSVALYAVSDPGTVVVVIEQIQACYAPTASNCLTLNSLIGNNDGRLYPIKSMNGVNVVLDTQAGQAAGLGRGFSGTTGTYAAYAAQSSVTQGTVTATWNGRNGTSSSLVAISGGWDRTAMTSQSGYTFLDGMNSSLSTPSLGSFNTVDHFGFIRHAAISPSAGVFKPQYNYCYFVGMGNIGVSNSAVAGVSNSKFICNLSMWGGAITEFINCEFLSCGGGGCTVGNQASSAIAAWDNIQNCTSSNNTGDGFNFASGSLGKSHNTLVANDNGGTGVTFSGSGNITVVGVTAQSNNNGISFNGGGHRVVNATTSGNSFGVATSNGGGVGGSNTLINLNASEATPVTVGVASGRIKSEREGGTVGNDILRALYGKITRQTALVKSPSTTAQKFEITGAGCISSNCPVWTSFAVEVKAGQSNTISLWALRTNSNLNIQARIIGGVQPGVGSLGSDVVVNLNPTANASPTSADFAQFSLPAFTPTNNCVVEVLLEAWTADGATSYYGVIGGPLTVT